MQIIEFTVFYFFLYPSKSFRFQVVKLWSIFYSKSVHFHTKKEFSTKFSIKSNLFYLESSISHFYKPFNYIVIVYGWSVAHSKPSIILPAEKRNVILFGFLMCRYNWEPCMSDCYINVSIRTI